MASMAIIFIISYCGNNYKCNRCDANNSLDFVFDFGPFILVISREEKQFKL